MKPRYQTSLTRTEEEVKLEEELKKQNKFKGIKGTYKFGLQKSKEEKC
jgi:hypothetical protein